jgi:uncharacterized repeat protein (TIGR03806 family)
MPLSPPSSSRLICLVLLLLAIALPDALQASDPASIRPSIGLAHRVPWTTSQVKGSPEPPTPYISQRVFERLAFNHPVEMTFVPGTNRLLVVELMGKVLTFPKDPQVGRTDLMLDLAQHVKGFYRAYGLTFHPQFAQNGYCYISYVLEPKQPEGTRVSRFKVLPGDPPRIDPASEEILISWRSGGHNGGSLQFGPDGFLYISAGDGGDSFPPDGLNSGQDLSNLLATVMRIDVDHADPGRPYRVPADNPFVDMAGVRPEIWAYGFRNPWKMSFHPDDGSLWVGDVGWELWELVYRVERGGNYGWSVMEGRQPVQGERKRGPTPILPPTVEHSHTEARSISGGYTYGNRSRLPELAGAWIYGDYVTGKVWGVRHNGREVTWLKELVDTPLFIVGFGNDSSGEVYLVCHETGVIHRLAPNPAAESNQEFPTKLSQTGLFASLKEHRPAAGVIPYSVNAEPWSDGLMAERFVAVPGLEKLGVYQTENVQVGYIKGAWKFPRDSVLVKTLSLPPSADGSRPAKRLETQLLHLDGDTWRGYAYVWNEEQTDAELAPAEGTDVKLAIESHSQTWHVASRTECILCHTTRAGTVHGFNPSQLNRLHDYGRGPADQLQTLTHIGLFEQTPDFDARPPANPYDETARLEARARSYLHLNCAHCHRRGGGGTAFIDLRGEIPLAKTNLLTRPTQGTFGIHGAQVIFPGRPEHSVLYYRLSKLGRGRMPYFGSSIVDERGVRLVHDWISQLDRPTDATAAEAAASVAQLSQREKQLAARLTSASGGELTGSIDQLLGSTSGALRLLEQIEQSTLPRSTREAILQKGVAHAEPQIRDLFERFVPEEQRVRRLGNTIKPAEILSLAGDAARGRALFTATAGVQCKNCHKAQGVGTELGPDLSAIGKKLNRAQLLESMLEPSRAVDPKYVTYLVETSQGLVYTGLLMEKTEQELLLKDAQNKPVRIPASDVELLAPQAQSLMPELLLRDMTAQEVADLLEFLLELRGE